ncbi:sel1 repeat family protein [Actinocrinis puniceicyclus]|uniref:Sel1 repeat family protein n=1 Tax=Actinocrinis puniceicyclus TaxID=977794 RepID=A0A8J7WVA8_9ACTN|nr:tetratricopeptide repeat protein [Actinocrinis puniceicyclus]MBS2965824.1 sel1 repeat family protein [Actinocrinis puniceicyclus]
MALLGIHAALPLPPESDTSLSAQLPEYVQRDVDTELRAAVGDAMRRSAFVVLVGSAASGKTRSAFEAVRAELADWRMIIPPTASDLDELVLSGLPLDHCVIWLDELARHLDSGALSLRTVHKVLAQQAGPLLVIGTMWPTDYDRISEQHSINERAPKLGGGAAAILRLATRFDIASAFTASERQRAAKISECDPRIREAIEHSTNAAIISSLACAPELIRRWEQPSDPVGAALITAAVEARLCGHPAVIPPGLLRLLAEQYLTNAQRAQAQPDWFDKALQWALHPVRGDVAALTPSARRVGELDGYQASDILTHRSARRYASRRQSPAKPWDVLVAYADRVACEVIAMFAFSSGYHDHAEAAWTRLADDGDTNAMIALGTARQDADDSEAAAAWYRRAVDAGEKEAMAPLAVALEFLGRTDEAREWIRRGAEAGVPGAMVGLGRNLEDAGDSEGARHWYEAAAAAGDHGMGMLFLGTMLRDQGDLEAACECLREAADAGRAYAEPYLQGIPVPVGVTDADLMKYQESVTRPYAEPAFLLGQIYRAQEQFEEAKTWFHRAGTLGHGEAMVNLGELLWNDDEHEMALTWFRPAAEAGSPEAMLYVGMILDESEETAEAGEWLRKAATGGFPAALGRYAIYLHEQGDQEEALEWASKAREAGDPIIDAYFAAVGGAGTAPQVRVTALEPDSLNDAINWTPLAHTCGCVAEWGWDGEHADPLSFIQWCCNMVTMECPWHATVTVADGRPPLFVWHGPEGPAFFARIASGVQAELGQRITSAIRELLAMTESGDQAGITADIPSEYRDWLESNGYNVAEAWLNKRLTDLVLNRLA